ncbi:large ribosomal subunit protein bL34m [Neocloeon triangulifer]|uniref:large ribosomal subunit protein bL34m n=1 Tax=Neocloeon triangulifer TaxID=2078957 RepID=UPI00286EC7F4|nr:large ribosomal subunit protein bL34m [Neocloeon triangulifer]
MNSLLRGFFNQSGLLLRQMSTPALPSFVRTPLLSIASKMQFSTTNALGNIRCHFPRPNEAKRIRRHGWKKRMSTLNGRKILMNRILKGRFVLSH